MLGERVPRLLAISDARRTPVGCALRASGSQRRSNLQPDSQTARPTTGSSQDREHLSIGAPVRLPRFPTDGPNRQKKSSTSHVRAGGGNEIGSGGRSTCYSREGT